MDTVVSVKVSGSSRPALVQEIRRVWSWCLLPDSTSPDVTVEVLVDPDPDAQQQARADGALAAADVAEAMHGLSPHVTLAAIEQQAGRLMMLHACGLADPGTGRTVALVAPSGTGKTTAARRLGRTLGYVTDETVAVRADGTIAPYPKPLSVRHESGSWIKDQVSLDDLGLLPTPDSCTLAGLAMLIRDGSSQAWLEPVSVVHGLALLAPETSYLARVPQPLHRLAELVEASGGLHLIHYQDSEQLAPLVTSLLSA